MNIQTLLHTASTYPAPSSESIHLDAELLLAEVLHVPRSYLYTWPERMPEPSQQEQFWALVKKRQEGVPIAYLLSQREFWSLKLTVNEHTLIPRSETELLVELALEKLANKRHAKIADLGTGSGAIALALAKERPADRVYATDKSPDALAIARQNSHNLGLANITFHQGDWCAALPEKEFDLIVSNPPYIAAEDPHLQTGDVRFEPKSALVSGEDGLNDLRIIIQQACTYLKPQGWLLLEHGYQQAESVRKLLKNQGYKAITMHRDFAGRERVTSACS